MTAETGLMKTQLVVVRMDWPLMVVVLLRDVEQRWLIIAGGRNEFGNHGKSFPVSVICNSINKSRT